MDCSFNDYKRLEREYNDKYGDKEKDYIELLNLKQNLHRKCNYLLENKDTFNIKILKEYLEFLRSINTFDGHVNDFIYMIMNSEIFFNKPINKIDGEILYPFGINEILNSSTFTNLDNKKFINDFLNHI